MTVSELTRADPLGKNQLADPEVAHGANDVPAWPSISCDTATAPPLMSTIAPTHGAPPLIVSGTEPWPWAGTPSPAIRVLPLLDTMVTWAEMARDPSFATTTVPSAFGVPTAPSVAPAQNQDVDIAAAGAATGTGATRSDDRCVDLPPN